MDVLEKYGNVITAKGIKKIFRASDKEEVYALNDVNIEIARGKLTVLCGKSGSGKTTLMNILSGLDKPSSGEVFFLGKEISGLTEEEKGQLRRKQLGFIFQSVSLIPVMTICENVEFALRLAGKTEGMHHRAKECLSLVGLEKRIDHMPQELSGGEMQRAAIARGIAHNPIVLFADEPTAELDSGTGQAVMKLFRNLVSEKGISIVMTTHDMSLLSDEDIVYRLNDGKIAE